MRLHVQIPAVRWAVPNALYDKALISTQQRRKALHNDPQASRCKIIVGFETISEHAYAFTAWGEKYHKRCFSTYKYRGCSLHWSDAFKSKHYRKPNDNRHPSLLQLKTNDNSSWEWEGMRKTLHIHLFLYLHKLTFAATHEKRLPSAFKMRQCISEREKEKLLPCQQVQVARTDSKMVKWHLRKT